MSTPPRDRHIPDLVSASEAAAILKVTRQAIQLMANNGQLLGAKVGKTWVFRRVVAERAATDRHQAEPLVTEAKSRSVQSTGGGA